MRACVEWLSVGGMKKTARSQDQKKIGGLMHSALARTALMLQRSGINHDSNLCATPLHTSPFTREVPLCSLACSRCSTPLSPDQRRLRSHEWLCPSLVPSALSSCNTGTMRIEPILLQPTVIQCSRLLITLLVDLDGVRRSGQSSVSNRFFEPHTRVAIQLARRTRR